MKKYSNASLSDGSITQKEITIDKITHTVCRMRYYHIFINFAHVHFTRCTFILPYNHEMHLWEKSRSADPTWREKSRRLKEVDEETWWVTCETRTSITDNFPGRGFHSLRSRSLWWADTRSLYGRPSYLAFVNNLYFTNDVLHPSATYQGIALFPVHTHVMKVCFQLTSLARCSSTSSHVGWHEEAGIKRTW